MESWTKESNSLVSEMVGIVVSIQSTTGHVESGGNIGGPSPKAKYDLVTERVWYREGKVKRAPGGE